jgi:hypothetical protein
MIGMSCAARSSLQPALVLLEAFEVPCADGPYRRDSFLASLLSRNCHAVRGGAVDRGDVHEHILAAVIGLNEGHGEARRLTPEGARGSLRRVSAVPIARRIEALEPLKAWYAEISATGG